ncbi:hypothetical protein ACHAW5_002298 [Stephanodiscus triporus]|uniref:Uncharacterized protein n=1 Tax=Stephanodiscus triporus TaxID=2934178 RepID=A0ABD3NIU0_9STRA
MNILPIVRYDCRSIEIKEDTSKNKYRYLEKAAFAPQNKLQALPFWLFSIMCSRIKYCKSELDSSIGLPPAAFIAADAPVPVQIQIPDEHQRREEISNAGEMGRGGCSITEACQVL